MQPFSLSVPASSANLGAGFDAVGVALSVRMHARVEAAAEFALTFEPSAHAPSHDGLASRIRRAMRAVDARLPAVHVRIANDVPLGKGLGSSACAAVLAAAAAMRAHGMRVNLRRIAQVAASVEGHPDNALAAVFGGAIVAADAGHFARFTCARTLRPLLVVPEVDLDTHGARMLLPASYERADVVFNVQRAALLGAALASGDSRHLREAMRDRIHQPYRAARIPGLAHALGLRDRALTGIALSGAGPSIIAIVEGDDAVGRIAQKLREPFLHMGVGVRVLPLQFSERGMQMRTLAKADVHAA